MFQKGLGLTGRAYSWKEICVSKWVGLDREGLFLGDLLSQFLILNVFLFSNREFEYLRHN